jgi:hypothetical protein
MDDSTLKDMLFEIQLRIMCQTVWSELAHVLPCKYDIEMSQYFLNEVDSLYDSDENVLETLKNFIKANGEDIYAKAEERPDVLFFAQPEIVVILERLENKRFKLIEYWEKRYPVEQLEHIANAWGISLGIDG